MGKRKMTQQDRELLRKVAERARQSGVRQSGGVPAGAFGHRSARNR